MKQTLRWRSAIIGISLFALVLALLAQHGPIKSSSSKQSCLALRPVQPSEVPISIANEDLETVKHFVLEPLENRRRWQQKNALVPPNSDWGGWVFEIRFLPPPKSPFLVLPLHQELHGFLLLRNAWKKPHDSRMIFLLDFQQMPVLTSEGIRPFYTLPALAPQEDYAFEFVIPPLPRGFHTLSFVMIADPQNRSLDPVYRAAQQDSFLDQRFDLWVGVKPFSLDVPALETLALGQAAVSRFAKSVDLVVTPQDPINEPLAFFSSKPGDSHCVYLRLYNEETEVNRPYKEPVPLHIVASWDDQLTEALDYDLLADAPRHLTLPLSVRTPTEPGLHQLQVMIFSFPGWSQYNDGTFTGFFTASFSRRVLVEVRP